MAGRCWNSARSWPHVVNMSRLRRCWRPRTSRDFKLAGGPVREAMVQIFYALGSRSPTGGRVSHETGMRLLY